jgi:hypothetical protein
VSADVKTLSITTDRWSEQSPVGEASQSGAREETQSQESGGNDKRVAAGGSQYGWSPGETPEEGISDVAGG